MGKPRLPGQRKKRFPSVRRIGSPILFRERNPKVVGVQRDGTVSRGAGRHTVLAGADSEAFTSLRRRPTARAERYAMGEALRQQVPRSSLGRLGVRRRAARTRSQLIRESHEGRLDELIPMRVGRMIGSPYGFLRGTAIVMAEDVAGLPATGITPVICGDSHLGNFGFYASPERDLVIDLNDFDEAHPGGWEWDLRRLVASIWVAGRQNGATEEQCEDAVDVVRRGLPGRGRVPGRAAAAGPVLQAARRRPAARDRDREDAAGRDRAVGERARTRTSDRALPRFTREHAGRRRIVEEPPLITRVTDADADAHRGRRSTTTSTTLAPHWRRVLGGYTLVDIAHKVVGVGSVGLRAYVALLEGSSPDDVVFLQLKQARRSVLAQVRARRLGLARPPGPAGGRVPAGPADGQRPAAGLDHAWTERQYYVRQFRNMKGTVPLDSIDPPALADYAGIVGHLLAKGHARTSGASMIAGYVGRSDKLDRALARFARLYADQTEADHAGSWPRSGTATCQPRTTLSRATRRSVRKSRAEADMTFAGLHRNGAPQNAAPERLSPAWRCRSGDTTKTNRVHTDLGQASATSTRPPSPGPLRDRPGRPWSCPTPARCLSSCVDRSSRGRRA